MHTQALQLQGAESLFPETCQPVTKILLILSNALELVLQLLELNEKECLGGKLGLQAIYKTVSLKMAGQNAKSEPKSFYSPSLCKHSYLDVMAA